MWEATIAKNERQIDDSLKALNLNWTSIWGLKFEVKRWKVKGESNWTKCKPSNDSNVRKQQRQKVWKPYNKPSWSSLLLAKSIVG